MKNLIKLTFIILLISTNSFSQSTILSEGFESGTLPTGWSEIKVTGNSFGNIVNWTFATGGYAANPASAKVGSKNARFFYDSPNFEKTKLVTKKLNMLGKVKPVLEFYHVQMYWIWGESPSWDQLKVYYKNNISNGWVLLSDYTQNIEDWTKHSIELPDSILTDNFYIAFEGINANGPSICIDDVQIRETNVAPRQVLNINASQPNIKFIPIGSESNPMMRLDVYVGGNNGTLTLNGLNINSKNTNDNDLANYGVRIFKTADTVWQNPIAIADSANFTAHTASLTKINTVLNSGLNTFWIAYNISPTANVGDLLDCSILASNTTVNNSTYPNSVLDPNGNRKIFDVLLFDNFETDKGWNLGGDFERDTAKGLGGFKGTVTTFGSPDPATAYSGFKVLGNDVHGIQPEANLKGNIEPNLVGFVYAVSPVINCRDHKNVLLSFKRQLGIHYSHKATIDISTDNGATWVNFWNNAQDGGSITDNIWTEREYDFSSIADRKSQVKIRFGIGETGSENIGCGWNIDDLTIIAEYVSNDIGVTQWNSPNTGCNLSSSETISVTVRNFANKPSSPNIPVKFTLDGTTFHYGTISAPIPAYTDQVLNFPDVMDLSQPGAYKLASASTTLTEDEDNRNNKITKTFYSLGYKTVPFKTNFENDSIWIASGIPNSWAYGKPSKTTYIKTAASGTKAFTTYLSSYYGSNDSSVIESPCFNFASITKPVIEFKFNSELEKAKDGVVLQYKKNDASPWKDVPNHAYAWKGNWYRNFVQALNTKGWDTLTTNWVTARQALPTEIAGESSVKFRFLFKSNGSNNFEGFSFDDFELLEAPIDAQILSINSLTDACIGDNKDSIFFTVKNVGIRPITTNDTMNVGFKIDNNPTVWENFKLGSSLAELSSINLKFSQSTNLLRTSGTHVVKVFINEKKAGFYETNNDTASKTVIIYPLPYSGLPDTISTARLDTLTIHPHIGTNYIFTWPDATHTTTWMPVTSGVKWVNILVSGANGCSIQDTFYVRKLNRDYKVSRIISPTSDCKLGTSSVVSFSIKNVGTDTLEKAETPSITTYYKFKGTTKSNVLTINSRIKPGDSIVSTFPLVLNGISPNDSIHAYFTKINLDNNVNNDTVHYKILEYGYPSLYLGPDATVNAAYQLLDAGAGRKAYLWNDLSTNQTYKAKFIGWHWAKVTDNNNCATTDSIYLTINSKDISVEEITNPTSACELGSTISPSIKIKNTGTTTIPSGTVINTGIKLNNGSYYLQNLNLSGDLASGASITNTFTTSFNLSTITSYKVSAFATYGDDMVQSNDTLIDTIFHYGYPALNLGSDLTFNGYEYTLDAIGGTGRKFLWQDGTTTLPTFKVTESGQYSVKVTDSISNCFRKDTIQVTLVIIDSKISDVEFPTSNVECTGTFNKLKVNLQNSGNTTISSGEKIILGYNVNGYTTRDTIFLSQALSPNAKLSHEFTNIPFTINTGTNNFKIFTSFSKDIKNINDTLFKTISIYNTPYVELGGTNGVIKSYSAVNLDAGSGSGYTYLWNDNTTLQTKTVALTGLTPAVISVKVSEPNGCNSTDTVRVSVFYPDVKVLNLKEPISNCINDISKATLVCQNTGNNTLKPGDKINISLITYKDGILYRTENKTDTIKKEIAYGDTFSYVYNGVNQNISLGNNELKFMCSNFKDVNLNDTSVVNLFVNQSPTFNSSPTFGINTEDSIRNALPPYPLTVGLGNDYTYLWQNGATTDPLNADTTAWYRVTATNKTTNCSYTDSIYIDMEINDMEVSNIVFGANKCMNELDGFDIEISNSGNRIIAANETIEIKYILNGTKTETFNITFPQGLASKEKYYVACKGLKSQFKSGSNTLVTKVIYSKDINSSNDNSTSTFTMYYKPELSLSSINDSIELMKPYSLTAGSNGSYNYAWSNGATGRVIEVGQSKKYVVTATDPVSGCTNKDSIFALLDVFDGITSASTPDPSCMSQINTLTVKFKNNGKYVFETGTSIEMGYIFNNNQSDKTNITLTQALNPGQEVSKTFTGLRTYNILGTNSIKAFCSTALDTVKQNDTATLALNLLISPSVSIAGGDTIYLDAPFLITAASPDDVNYLWNTGEAGNSIKVINSGLYKVKAVNKVNTCFASDSVFIYPKYTDGSLSKAELSPLCFNTTNSIIVTYKNVGQINLVKGDTLDIYYRFNTSSTKVIKQFLASDIEKNESKQLSMNINRAGLVAGSNKILVYAKNRKDQNSINDTIRTSITLNASPAVNLAGGKDLVSFTGSYKLDAGAGFKSYLWNTKATSQTITVAASGWIGVTVTNTLGCAGWDSVLMQMRTDAIESLVTSKNLNIYPVPAKTHFSIEIKEVNLTDPVLEIYSSDMKLVLKEHYIAISEGFTRTFNSTNWEKGMYYVCIREKSGKILLSNKFLIQ